MYLLFCCSVYFSTSTFHPNSLLPLFVSWDCFSLPGKEFVLNNFSIVNQPFHMDLVLIHMQ